MAKVKVYELAKELNINSKEIINFLSEKKIEVKSHMSNLEDASIELIRGKYAKKGDEDHYETRNRNKTKGRNKSKRRSSRSKAQKETEYYGGI